MKSLKKPFLKKRILQILKTAMFLSLFDSTQKGLLLLNELEVANFMLKLHNLSCYGIINFGTSATIIM